MIYLYVHDILPEHDTVTLQEGQNIWQYTFQTDKFTFRIGEYQL